MFIKTARVKIISAGCLKDLKENLRKDEFWGPEIDRTLQKVAAVQPIARYLEDFIYTRQRAISAFEHHGFNGNKDAFREKELIKAHASFINTGFFKDHRNWDKKFAYGINLDARYHPNHFIEVISAVSRKMQPDSEEVVRNILSGKWCETSMGAEVQVSECSICGNRATREAEFCRHIRHCKGSKVEGQDVFEFNEGLNFFDESVITTEAAEREALITQVYTKEDMEKVASQEHPILSMVRTPHLDVRICTNCKEDIKPCGGGCKNHAAGPSQEAPSAMISKGCNGSEHSEESGKKSVPHISTQEGNPMETQAIQKKAEDAASKPTVGDKERISQQPTDRAEDYNRSSDPNKAAFDEAKKGSDATSKPVVGKEDQISQKKDEDYPHQGSAKTSAKSSRFASVLKSIGQSLVHLAEGGEASTPVAADVAQIAVVKATARKALSGINKALEVLDSRKAAAIGKVTKSKLASIKRRANEELAELNEMEGDLNSARTGIEEGVCELGKMEDGICKGEEVPAETEVVQLQQDILESVEEVKDLVVELVGEEKAEDKPEPKKEPKAEKEDDKKEDKKEDEKGEGKKTSNNHKPDCDCNFCKNSKGGDKKDDKKEEKEAALSKKADEVSAPAGKQEAGNPQLLIDRGDYNRSTAPNSAAASDAKSQESASRSDIDKQRETGFSSPAEQQAQREIRLAANRFYRGLREAGLKHAVASRKVRSWVRSIQSNLQKLAATPTIEDLKKQIVDEVSKRLVEEILDSRPEAADTAGVGAPPEAQVPGEEMPGEGGEEAAKPAEMFGTPPVTVSSSKRTVKAEAGEPKSDETPGPKSQGEMPSDPADPAWDLFSEDKVTETASRTNSEQESALREELKGVYVPESAGTESGFRGQIDPKTLKAKSSSDVSLAEQRRMAQALELAQTEVEAGLIEESQLENESKRLFLMSPSELKATAEMVTRTRKLAAFQHPDANDPTILKHAVQMGHGSSSDLDGHLFDE